MRNKCTENLFLLRASVNCTNNKVVSIKCVEEPSCGTSSKTSRIVGGQDANIAKHPWQVTIITTGILAYLDLSDIHRVVLYRYRCKQPADMHFVEALSSARDGL